MWLTLRQLARRLLLGRPPSEVIKELRDSGLLEERKYCVLRAIEVAAFEDEGRHLYLELSDGTILCLMGQYLVDYGWFPTTEFTAWFHCTECVLYDLIPAGKYLAPEATFPPYTPAECDRQLFGDDFLNKGRIER